MRQLKILSRLLKQTGANRIWMGFLVFFFFCSVVIWLREPDIHRLGDAMWYCYATVTTIGFGDVTVHYHLSRALSVLLSIYAVLVIAIITGVVVNYYNQLVRMRQKDSLAAVLDKMERLPELSKEELTELSEKVRQFQHR